MTISLEVNVQCRHCKGFWHSPNVPDLQEAQAWFESHSDEHAPRQVCQSCHQARDGLFTDTDETTWCGECYASALDYARQRIKEAWGTPDEVFDRLMESMNEGPPLEPRAVADMDVHAHFIELRVEARRRLDNGESKGQVVDWLLDLAHAPIEGDHDSDEAIQQVRYQVAAQKVFRQLQGIKTLREMNEGY